VRSTLRRLSTIAVLLGILGVAMAATAWDRQAATSGPIAEAAQRSGGTGTCDPIPPAGKACITAQGPAPVIPEASLPVLLPLTAGAVLIGALWLVRQRGNRRHDARGREAADGG
jgi:hypothetical protein